MGNLFVVSAPGAPSAIQAYMEIKCEPVNTDEDPPEGPELIRLYGWEHVPNFWYGRVDDWTPGGGSHVVVQERNEHWTHKRQHLMTANRSNDYNHFQNPKHTYSAPIQEDHLNHSKSMHV